MALPLRLGIPVLLVAGVVVAGIALSGGLGMGPRPSPSADPGASLTGSESGIPAAPTIEPPPTPQPPEGGTELYGYLPYWEMSDSTAAYLRSTPLSTIALFSVSARRNGALDTRQTGYARITGDIGRGIIADAHERGARVELAFTSFGPDKNGAFFGRIPRGQVTEASAAPDATPSGSSQPSPPPWQRAVDELVTLAVDLGVDGINVDVEQLDELDRDAYGEFLVALRARLVAALPNAQVSVATEAGLRGVGNAGKAAASGVDRLFLMGYDYHWSGSQPGASSPVERTDGEYDLRWSIDRYVEAGVPRDRILLGLPLYGMVWRTIGPDRTAPVIGSGQPWIPGRHLDVVRDPTFTPGRDPLEVVEFFIRPDGDDWLVTYYDSPSTLRAKLALARDAGLAGGGFWAIGYERGLPGFASLYADFRAGLIERTEAPPR